MMLSALSLSAALLSDRSLDIANWLLWAADYSQSIQIIDHPAYTENNIFLPDNPSRRHINTLFATSAALYIATDWMPDGWRRLAKIQFVVGRGAVVAHNAAIGLRVRWK